MKTEKTKAAMRLATRQGGPWSFAYDEAEMNARVNGKGGLVAVVWSGRNPHPGTVVANARLISSAPALLNALREAAAIISAYQDPDKPNTADSRFLQRVDRILDAIDAPISVNEGE